MNRPRVVFAGTGGFAVPLLRRLSETTDVLLAISAPAANPVADLAQNLGLPLARPEKIATLNAELATLHPDLLVVADYGQIIPTATLETPTRGSLNVHPSLLPRHRGPAPISATILAGDRETGISIIAMDDRMDHGPMVAQERYPLTGRETAPELELALAERSADLLGRTIPRLLSGAAELRPQDHRAATYHKLLRRADGEIDWREGADRIERKFRALQPWPGLWFRSNVRHRPRIIKLLGLANQRTFSPPAGIFSWDSGRLYLGTADRAVEVTRLQVAGGRPLTAEEFYRGYGTSGIFLPTTETTP